jgi:uncharacterized protein (TIGR01777 family)
MNIGITGANGFLGKSIWQFMEGIGNTCFAIERKNLSNLNMLQKIRRCEGVINLAGATIQRRWTKRQKEKIYKSRVETTRNICRILKEEKGSVKWFIQASAVGIYDDCHLHDEDSTNYAESFLSYVVQAWEKETELLKEAEIRLIILRMGVVLDQSGGFYKKIDQMVRWHVYPVFCFRVFLPAIHLKDLLKLILYIARNDSMEGVYNVVIPNIFTYNELINELKEKYGAGITIRLKMRLIQYLLGERAVLFTEGQQVISSRLLQAGFVFESMDVHTLVNQIRHITV